MERDLVAIVTTVADAAEHISNFIRYHLNIGIDHIYIFVDDNCETTLKILEQYSEYVTYYTHEDMLFHWSNYEIFIQPKKNLLHTREVMIRQELNLRFAQDLARKNNHRWIFHIDLDELIFLNDNILHDYIKTLKSKKIYSINLKNYESITKFSSSNIYKTTNVFKKNYFRRGLWTYSKKQLDFIKKTPWLHDKYFNYYQNGKSLFDVYRKNYIRDVHSIRDKDSKYHFGTEKDLIILHFPCANYAEFNKKYSILGDFYPYWNGKVRAGKFLSDIHIKSRNAFIKNSNKKEFYEKYFIIDESKISKLIDIDLAVEINISKDMFEEKYKKKSMANAPKKYITQSNRVECLSMEEIFTLDCRLSFEDESQAKYFARRFYDKEISKNFSFVKKNKVYISLNGEWIYDFNKIIKFLNDDVIDRFEQKIIYCKYFFDNIFHSKNIGSQFSYLTIKSDFITLIFDKFKKVNSCFVCFFHLIDENSIYGFNDFCNIISLNKIVDLYKNDMSNFSIFMNNIFKYIKHKKIIYIHDEEKPISNNILSLLSYMGVDVLYKKNNFTFSEEVKKTKIILGEYNNFFILLDESHEKSLYLFNFDVSETKTITPTLAKKFGFPNVYVDESGCEIDFKNSAFNLKSGQHLTLYQKGKIL